MTKDHARWRWMWTNLHRGQHPHAWSGAQASWAPREQRQEIEPHQGQEADQHPELAVDRHPRALPSRALGLGLGLGLGIGFASP